MFALAGDDGHLHSGHTGRTLWTLRAGHPHHAGGTLRALRSLTAALTP